MNKISSSVLLTALALIAVPALSQSTAPVDSIRQATWQAYSSYYPRSSVCAKDEITLWSCTAGKREYSLCSSQMMTRTQGYMQYRAFKVGKLVFEYPATKRLAEGEFVYESSGNGNASVEFVNQGYRYTLFDPLRGASSISVDMPNGKSAEIPCDNSNQTLQLNYSLRLMYDSGVWER